MTHASPILLLLMQIGIVLAVSRFVGWVFGKLGQPQVMGEMIAGIMLGPSLLGLFWPGAMAAIFPPQSLPLLNILSQLGVIIFLFLIGLELDPKLIRNRGHAAVFISHASIVAPFILGALLAVFLYPRLFHQTEQMRFIPVALFMGAAMSITAFPVLARILTERNLHRTRVGAVAITCAAVDDVTAWCLLAFVVAIAKTDTTQGITPALITAGLAIGYVLVMFFAIRPLAGRLQLYYDRTGRLNQHLVAAALLLMMASAYTTEKIGIHALFGAFLMGALMPKGGGFARELTEKLEDFTVVFLLPIFFAFTGLKTQIGLLDNAELWMYTLLIIGVACLGKFGGSTIAARLSGFNWRESSAIGILMNTRGLMELLILNIGRELGVITDAVFAMMVIMAIATTAMTTPILAWVYPRRLFGEDVTGPAKVKPGFSVLIPIAFPRSGAGLLELAGAIAGRDASHTIYALHLRRPVDRDAYRSGIDPEPEAEPLQPLLAHAAKLGVPVEPISFVSRDVATDVASLAEHRKIDLVLMGFHKPVIGTAILGGTVHKVLSQTETNVAILVDRGYRGVKKILVPYLGSQHDTLAMEIARRLGAKPDVQITILHVVGSERTMNAAAVKIVEKVFSEPGIAQQVHFKVVQDEDPVGVVLQYAKEADLTIIGVGEEWGIESQLIGFKSERIAQELENSLLIVRRHHALPAPAPSPPLPGGERAGVRGETSQV